MSSMKRLDERGDGPWLLLFVVFLMLFIFSAVFAIWAYQGRQDYKNNVDQKVAVAVDAAKKQQSTTDSKNFAEAEKLPLRAYKGPEAYGSLVINYPKTWSAYVDDSGSTNQTPVNGYFYPGTVPSTSDQDSVFALRVQVLAQAYSDVVSQLTNQGNGQQKFTVSPYSPPKVPKAVGIRIDGQLSDTKTGSMVVLPLRDKTLELSTESQQFENDFNNNILPNFTFIP